MLNKVYKCLLCSGVWYTDRDHPIAPGKCPIDDSRLRDITRTNEGRKLLLSSPEHLDPDLSTALLQFMTSLTDFIIKKSELCPHCGKKVSRLDSIARSVYLRPCNCRLWTGRIPEAWK